MPWAPLLDVKYLFPRPTVFGITEGFVPATWCADLAEAMMFTFLFLGHTIAWFPAPDSV